MMSVTRTRQAAAKMLRVLEERTDPVPAWKLSLAAGLPDGDNTHRDARRAVAHLSRAGFPVVHVHGQGYRLARSGAEIDAYIGKMEATNEALTERIEKARAYRKLYLSGRYAGPIHGPVGELLERLTGADIA